MHGKRNIYLVMYEYVCLFVYSLEYRVLVTGFIFLDLSM